MFKYFLFCSLILIPTMASAQQPIIIYQQAPRPKRDCGNVGIYTILGNTNPNANLTQEMQNNQIACENGEQIQQPQQQNHTTYFHCDPTSFSPAIVGLFLWLHLAHYMLKYINDRIVQTKRSSNH